MKKTALFALAALAASTLVTVVPNDEPADTDAAETHLVEATAPDEISPAAPPHSTVLILEHASPQPERAELPVFAGYQEDWHQANDALIARVVGEFNAEMGWTPDHEDYLDPVLVKAWALQESGGHRGIFTSGDMMQMNNRGDWAAEKEWFGVHYGEKLTPEESLRAALGWAYYKGEETRRIRGGQVADGWYATTRGGAVLEGYESRFTSWQRALTRYNGGGVADYHGDIMRRLRQVT